MSRPNWLRDAIAKNDGYYSPRGEKLKAVRLTDAQVASWNGTDLPKKKEEPTAEPQIEAVAVEENVTPPPVVSEEVVKEKPTPKKRKRRILKSKPKND